MTRTERLFALLHELRARQRAVSAQALADTLGISVRSVYRDIDTLRGLGADIDGEAGVGFQLRQGFFLPPLALNDDELEAMLLGLHWVRQNGDSALAAAADDALVKLKTVINVQQGQAVAAHGLLIPPASKLADDTLEIDFRLAVRKQRQVRMTYCRTDGEVSERVIYPIAIGYFDDRHLLAAWCTLRESFRHFRLDRVVEYEVLAQQYSGSRETWLSKWMKVTGIPEQVRVRTTDKN
ncbi:YafY family transcriptional regulator [Cardiobacteriaceae bacterium TAE3-ERU3]|nr:YafY family transcriptional regulator [Cardiobacteriaceae bacterium TAE3-ERU3]